MKLFRLFAYAALSSIPLSLPAAADAPVREAFAARAKDAAKNGGAAVAGKDGWLFLGAELRFLSLGTFWGDAAARVSRAPKPDLADPIPAIVDFQKQLQARGIDLLLVPVPPKAALCAEQVPIAPDAAALAPLAQFYQELKTQGVDVLDLTAELRTKPGGEAAFCKTDTHWSGEGCVAASKRIAAAVKSRLAVAQPAAFTSEWTEAEIDGDLVALLPKDASKPPREKLRLRQVKNANGGAVEADPASPLLLLGDSHTLVFHEFAAERAGLLDQLALELGAAPDLIGTRGSGSTAVRISLYRKTLKDPDYLAKKKVVVWCFTAREFTESDQGWAKLPISK